jgi:hypothetical protein
LNRLYSRGNKADPIRPLAPAMATVSWFTCMVTKLGCKRSINGYKN